MSAGFAPQLIIKDGKVVINEESLTVTPSAPRIDYSQFTVAHDATDKHITSATYSKHAPTGRWTLPETKLFYKAIRMYGTDFSMIEKLFPKRTRRQVSVF